MRNFLDYFKEQKVSPRPLQTKVLEDVQNAWDSHTNFVIDAPTGVGKTHIALAIASAVSKAYVLTSTLSLQNQYESTYDEVVNLKGRSNYNCGIQPMFSVDMAQCSVTPAIVSTCNQKKICPYYNQRDKAIQSQVMITNPAYLLNSIHAGWASPSAFETPGQWRDMCFRDVLIIDEAHKLEEHLVSFATVDVSIPDIQKNNNVDLLGFKFVGSYERDYDTLKKIYDKLMNKMQELIGRKDQLFREFGLDSSSAKDIPPAMMAKYAPLRKEINALDEILRPINVYYTCHKDIADSRKNWVLDVPKDSTTNIKVAPLFASIIFNKFLKQMAAKFVFMSATIGNSLEFCKEIGLDPKDSYCIAVPTPFPAEKSPVIFAPAINLTAKFYKQNVEKVGKIIDVFLNQNANVKGIIHATTYDIVYHIVRGVSPQNRKRLLHRDMIGGKNNNEHLIRMHTESKQPTVLLSPSMMEGVDLYGDLSRFQIMMKLPCGYLGDARIRTKANLQPSWYTNDMWMKLMQASGRSTRSMEDSSITYVIDETFKTHYNTHKNGLPEWFTERVVMK